MSAACSTVSPTVVMPCPRMMHAGLAPSDGLIVSLLFGASYLAVGALGGLVWVFTTRRTERIMADGTLGTE